MNNSSRAYGTSNMRVQLFRKKPKIWFHSMISSRLFKDSIFKKFFFITTSYRKKTVSLKILKIGEE